jgi:hypothetical protein
MEELGKSIAFRLCYEGHAHLEGSGKRAEVVVTIPFMPEKRYYLSRHEPKRDLLTGLLLAFLAPSIFAILVAATSTPRGQEEVAKLAESDPTPSKPIRFSLEDLDKLREAGLYVELIGDRLTAPQDVSQSSYQELDKATVAFLDATKDSHERGITAQFLELVDFALGRLIELSEKWRIEASNAP